jgi:hypothetical protein
MVSRMLALRWFRLLPLALVTLLAFGAAEAHAQVFKPRSGKTAGRTGAAAARKTASTAGPSTAMKPARATATTSRRAGTTAPAKKARSKARGNDDVKIEDDDDDVKITDDE